MVVLGAGNVGSKLAVMFDKNATIFSTAKEDGANYKDVKNHYVLASSGARKNYKIGSQIWSDNINLLKKEIGSIKDEKVILFSSLGGGSGSSSLQYFSKILLENNNKVLVVGCLPYKKELNPALANSVNTINSLLPIVNDISIMIFDNETLLKRYKNDWEALNKHIVSKVDYAVNLLDKYNTSDYSPLTLDSSELESVVFGGGFIDLSDDFLEEVVPKFEYGSLDKFTKNCLICMFVDAKIPDRKVNKLHTIYTGVLNKYSSKVPNARMIPGILRGNFNFTNSKEKINDRCYITIASGLSIDKYLKKVEKLRDEAIKKATVFVQKEKAEKIVAKKDIKLLDI